MSNTWVPRILLVDDSPYSQDRLRKKFQALGFKVEVASDGASALQHLDRLPCEDLPHLVVTDIQMPEMDGPKLIETMHEYPVYRQLSVIAYSPDPRDLSLSFRSRKSLGVVPFEEVEDAVVSRIGTLRNFYTRRGSG